MYESCRFRFKIKYRLVILLHKDIDDVITTMQHAFLPRTSNVPCVF